MFLSVVILGRFTTETRTMASQPGSAVAAGRLSARGSPRRMASRRQTLPLRNHPGAAHPIPRKLSASGCPFSSSHGIVETRRASRESRGRFTPLPGTRPYIVYRPRIGIVATSSGGVAASRAVQLWRTLSCTVHPIAPYVAIRRLRLPPRSVRT